MLFVKDMEDGSKAVGLCNRGEVAIEVTAKWSDLGLKGKQRVRDLWRQKDLGDVRRFLHRQSRPSRHVLDSPLAGRIVTRGYRGRPLARSQFDLTINQASLAVYLGGER